MTKRESPLNLHRTLKRILDEYRKLDVVYDNGLVPNLLASVLLTVELHHFPKPFTHGKVCSNCDHRMHCKSIRCPLCYKEMRKRKRQGCEENKKKEEKKEDKCDCTICARFCLSYPMKHHTLSCGHRTCYTCMEEHVSRGYRTCSRCDEVRIPEDVVLKYI